VKSRNTFKTGLLNGSFVLLSQIITLSVAIGMGLIIPKVLGIEQFGYWSIYLFYAGYTGVLQFGLVDGIYLRYGSYEYQDLPKELFRSVFLTLLSFQIIITLFLYIMILIIEKDIDKLYIYLFAATNIPLGVYGIFVMVTQVTNRFKEYSIITGLSKILLCIFAFILYYLGFLNDKTLILSDLLVKLLLLFISIYFCKDLVVGYRMPISEGLTESVKNVSVGINLMLANFLAMLLVGIGRYIIEKFESVAIFGIYSFAINTTSLVMIFVSSISLVLYPILTRLNKESLPKYYDIINTLLIIIILILMLSYYPLEWVIKSYLIEYIPVLDYLYLLFPIVVFQGKMQLLVNNYYKVLREERALLFANLSAVFIFSTLGISFYNLFRNINTIVWCTLLVIAWRCYASEIYIKRKLNINYYSKIYIEIVMIAIFILSAGVVQGVIGLILYVSSIILFFTSNSRSIITIFRSLIEQIKIKDNIY
jgi:O-antigen/teichoic acid export membrane protein